MRVQCDVCGREPAAVLCCADEAALCAACDRRVHGANKLAGKHRRFSLLSPAASGGDGSAAAPLCDVCQERRGLVFCVEDRAILCSDCDEPIHGANELTARHSRFLLVGAKLSAAPMAAAAPPSPDDSEEHDEIAGAAGSRRPEEAASAAESSGVLGGTTGGHTNGAGAGSSITEYLTKVCPGWRVEDLLLIDDAAAAAAAAAQQKKQEELVPFLDEDELFGGVAAAPPRQEQSAWAPPVPQAAWSDFGLGAAAPPAKGGRGGRTERWSDNDAFTVPQISPPANPGKRARPSLWYY